MTRADPPETRLPKRVTLCPACVGRGRYTWEGGCLLCDNLGYVYAATARPVPTSVLHQIAEANGLSVRVRPPFAAEWSEKHGDEEAGAGDGRARRGMSRQRRKVPD